MIELFYVRIVTGDQKIFNAMVGLKTLSITASIAIDFAEVE